MNKVIVIGCHVTGLGVIRALGLKNIPVVAMTYEKRTDMAHISKYVSEKVEIPHPRKEEKEFIDFLIRNSHRWHGALILDMDDHVAVSISKNKVELSKYYRIVTAEWQVLRMFIEKEKTYKLAQRYNVPHPQMYLPKTFDELCEIKDKIKFPIVLKPVRGHEFKAKFNKKLFEINDESELFDKFRLCLDSEMDVICQEVIPGPDTNIYKLLTYVNSQGNISAKFFYKKLRQNPPGFGIMRVGLSQERNPEVEQLSEKLLKHSNFRGFCNIEFKKDPRDGQLKLIEVNVRANRTNWLATYCGVNFPWIIYMDLVENQQIEVEEYEMDVYWIELYADLLNSIFRYDRENFRLSDYFKPYLSKNKAFAVLDRNDLLPFIKETVSLPLIFYRFLKSGLMVHTKTLARKEKIGIMNGHVGKILMLVENRFPGDPRVRSEAFTLAKAGYKVSVIAQRKSKNEKIRDVVNGVNVYRLPYINIFKKSTSSKRRFQILLYRIKSAIGYIFEYFYFTTASLFLSLFILLKEKIDVIHIHNPPNTLFIIGALYKLFGKKFVFDHHDLAPELFLSKYGLKGGFIYKALLLEEKLCLRFADMVIATNESYKKIEIKRGNLKPESIFVVRNGPDLNEMRLVPPDEKLKKMCKSILIYIGVMNPQDGVDYLLRALNCLVHEFERTDFYCVIIGRGDAVKDLKKLTHELKLEDYVWFTGHIPKQDLIRYLSTADIAVDPNPSSPLNDFSTWIKVMEYMALGKPIVSFDLPETRYTAQEAAIYATPNNELEFAQAIVRLMDNPAEREKMGAFGQKRIRQDLAWQHVSRNLLSAYESIFNQQGAYEKALIHKAAESWDQ